MSAEDSARNGWSWMTLLTCLCWQDVGQGGPSKNDLSSHRLSWAPSAVASKFRRSTREASPKVRAHVKPLHLSYLLLFYWPKQVTWSRPESMQEALSKLVGTERRATLWAIIATIYRTKPAREFCSVTGPSLLVFHWKITPIQFCVICH